MSLDLMDPILDGAVRSVAFFNGRLLTAEDLRQDRDATREYLRRLGRAGGEGVGYGLEVAVGRGSQQVPVVTVSPGVAVNRTGHALALTKPAELRLSRPAVDAGPLTPGEFDDCPRGITPPVGADAGLYVLVVGPAKAPEGRVPVSGLTGATATCNTRYTVEGVRFRLAPLPLTVAELNDPDRLRNEAAHRCFGLTTAAYTARFADPIGTPPGGYGLIDRLRADGMVTDCEVPLALVRLTDAGIEFLDPWAVRRRVVAPDAGSGPWPTDRRAAEGEAMIAQFRDHARDLFARVPTPGAVSADRYFRFLPPAGLLPVAAFPGGKGFDADVFFGGRGPDSPGIIAGEQLPRLFRDAAQQGPIRLTTPDPDNPGEDRPVRTAIQLFQIRENLESRAVDGRVQPVLVFVSPSVSVRGQARFGHARFGHDSFAPAAG